MGEDNGQYAYFTLVGNFDPSTVSARLGLQPTKAWQKGELHPRTPRERTFSRWSLHSRLGREIPLERHVEDVLAQLAGHESAVREASHEFNGCMQLVGYFYLEYPGLELATTAVAGIAALGLKLDFDFYGLYSHRREDTA
jgi:hypothetical protein